MIKRSRIALTARAFPFPNSVALQTPSARLTTQIPTSSSPNQFTSTFPLSYLTWGDDKQGGFCHLPHPLSSKTSTNLSTFVLFRAQEPSNIPDGPDYVR